MISFTWDVLTLFPDIISAYVHAGILDRAQKDNKITVCIHNLRDFTEDKHRTADDYPYGGDVGMVLKPEPIFRAVEKIREQRAETRVILLTPQGRTFDHETAKRLAAECSAVTLICGRYEGVDERVAEHLADEEISIGDYVLGGGELAALVILDAVSRFLPGVVGDDRSVATDSFTRGIFKHPQYTRPEVYRGMRVPEVLLSGHHREIDRYQKYRGLEKTFRIRPDLLGQIELTEEEKKILARIRQEKGHHFE